MRGAEREFNAALGLDRGVLSRPRRRWGSSAWPSGTTPDAVARFDRALVERSGYVPALVGRGEAFARAGRIDDALAQLQGGAGADPSLGDIRRRLEVIAFRHQQD